MDFPIGFEMVVVSVSYEKANLPNLNNAVASNEIEESYFVERFLVATIVDKKEEP